MRICSWVLRLDYLGIYLKLVLFYLTVFSVLICALICVLVYNFAEVRNHIQFFIASSSVKHYTHLKKLNLITGYLFWFHSCPPTAFLLGHNQFSWCTLKEISLIRLNLIDWFKIITREEQPHCIPRETIRLSEEVWI